MLEVEFMNSKYATHETFDIHTGDTSTVGTAEGNAGMGSLKYEREQQLL